MTRFKVILLLIAIVAFSTLTMAQGGGPSGVKAWLGWGSSATSTLDASGDTLTFALTGVPADRDIYFCAQEEDGTKHIFKWDDGYAWWDFSGIVRTGSYFLAYNSFRAGSSSNHVGNKVSGTVGILYSTGTVVSLLADPNDSGSGTLQLGETGDNDITLFQSQQRVDICTVDSTHTMGSDGTSFYTVTSASDSLLCPSSPTDGDLFQCKFTDSGGGTIDGNGNNIDGSASFAASEDDNYIVIYNTDSGEWEIR